MILRMRRMSLGMRMKYIRKGMERDLVDFLSSYPVVVLEGK